MIDRLEQSLIPAAHRYRRRRRKRELALASTATAAVASIAIWGGAVQPSDRGSVVAGSADGDDSPSPTAISTPGSLVDVESATPTSAPAIDEPTAVESTVPPAPTARPPLGTLADAIAHMAGVGLSVDSQLLSELVYVGYESNESADAFVFSTPDGDEIAVVRRVASLPDGGVSRSVVLDGRAIQLTEYPPRSGTDAPRELRASEELRDGLLIEIVGRGDVSEDRVVELMLSLAVVG